MTLGELKPLVDGLIALGHGDDDVLAELDGRPDDWVLIDVTPTAEQFTVLSFARREQP